VPGDGPHQRVRDRAEFPDRHLTRAVRAGCRMPVHGDHDVAGRPVVGVAHADRDPVPGEGPVPVEGLPAVVAGAGEVAVVDDGAGLGFGGAVGAGGEAAGGAEAAVFVAWAQRSQPDHAGTPGLGRRAGQVLGHGGLLTLAVADTAPV